MKLVTLAFLLLIALTFSTALCSQRSYSSWFGFDIKTKIKKLHFSFGETKSALPPGAVMRLGTNSFKHPFPITVDGLQFSPKGSYLASKSGFGTVVWHVKSGNTVVSQKGVRSFCFSSDERYFALTARWSEDVPGSRMIRNKSGLFLVDLKSKEKKLLPTSNSAQVPEGVHFSPDNTKLRGRSFRTTFEWDLKTLAVSKSQKEKTKSRYRHGAIKSKDGRLLIWAPGQRKGKPVTIHVCDAKEDNRELFVLSGHKFGFINNKVISQDGRLLATAGTDGHFKVWDLDNGVLKYDLKLKRRKKANVGSAMVFSPNGRYLVGGRVECGWHLWDMTTGELVRHWQSKGFLNAVAISPDGTTIAYVHDSKQIIFQDLLTGENHKRVRNHLGALTACLFSHDGKRVFSSCDRGCLFEWALDKGQIFRRIERGGGRINSMALSPCGKSLFYNKGSAIASYGLAVRGRKTVARPGGTIHHISFNDRGTLLAVKWTKGSIGRGKNFISVFDVSTWQQLSQIELKGFVTTPAEFVPGTDKFLAGEKKSIYLFDGKSGKKLSTFKTPAKRYLRWIKSWPGNEENFLYLAVTNGLFIHDSPEPFKLYRSILDDVDGAHFAPNSPFLAVAFQKNARMLPTIRFYDVEQRKLLAELAQDCQRLTCLSFSASGRYLVSGGDDSTLLIWDLSKVLK